MPSGEYFFPDQQFTSTAYVFDELVRLGVLSKTRVKVHSAGPEAVFGAMADKARINSLLWFPHFAFNAVYNKTRIVPLPKPLHLLKNFVVGHEALFRDALLIRSLEVCIRDAWLTLVEQPAVLRRVIDLLFEDEDYWKLFSRSSGLHLARIDKAAEQHHEPISILQPRSS